MITCVRQGRIQQLFEEKFGYSFGPQSLEHSSRVLYLLNLITRSLITKLYNGVPWNELHHSTGTTWPQGGRSYQRVAGNSG